MALQRGSPTYYSTGLSVTSTTTGGEEFGFTATYLRLVNTCSDDAYLKFSSVGAATCADFRLRACSECVITGVPISAITGYSTGVAGAYTRVNITAMGGGGY